MPTITELYAHFIGQGHDPEAVDAAVQATIPQDHLQQPEPVFSPEQVEQIRKHLGQA